MPNHNTYRHIVPLSWAYAIAWETSSPSHECEVYRKDLTAKGLVHSAYEELDDERACLLLQGDY